MKYSSASIIERSLEWRSSYHPEMILQSSEQVCNEHRHIAKPEIPAEMPNTAPFNLLLPSEVIANFRAGLDFFTSNEQL